VAGDNVELAVSEVLAGNMVNRSDASQGLALGPVLA